MNYFTRIKKSLLLVLISLFIQSCDKTCIKSNDFGEQSNVDLFKISAKDLSECVFDESSKDSSYSKMPAGGMLKKCIEGYKYDEDKNEYSTKPEDTVLVLIGYGYLDLGNSSDIFNAFKNKLEEDTNKALRETFEGYYCKDFDYLTDQESNFIKAFKGNETVIKGVDLIELNKRIYQECGNYCSNVCSGSLSTNNTSFDAATFSQLSWPHSALKSSGSYYGINFKSTSNFKIAATGSIQTNGIGTNVDANNSSIIINNNPYLPSYNLNSSSVWKATDKASLFARIEMPKALSTNNDSELFSKFYLDFVNFSDTKLQPNSVPIECDNTNVNMPNYVQRGENGNEYKGALVFAEPKYSSVYCTYNNGSLKNICDFRADYTKLLKDTDCLSTGRILDDDDLFNNMVDVEPFNNMQKNYYKYTASDLEGIDEGDKRFVLSRGENEETQEFTNSDNDKITLKYYEYTYEDSDGEFVLQYTIDEENLNYTGQSVFEFGKDLSMPFKVYIKFDKEGLSNSNKCTFTVNAKNNIDNFIKNKIDLTDATVSDISYENIVISNTDTWYPITQGGVPAVLNEYYSNAIVNNNFSVKLITSDAGCFKNLIVKIVPLREIEINKTGFLFFRNVLDDADNKIKFQVINSDLDTIVDKINKSKDNTKQLSIDDYKKEIKSNYFEYYQYNKTRTDADMVNDTFTELTTIKADDLKKIELLGTTLKESSKDYNSIFTKNAIFVRKGQVIRFDDSNWLNTSNLTIKTKVYEDENIANNIDLIYFVKERPALMCLTDKFSRTINIKNSCSNAVKKNLYSIENSILTNAEQYLCNIDIKKEKVDETDNNKNCYVYIGVKTGSNESKFTNLKYLEIGKDMQTVEEKNAEFITDSEEKINYISVAEAFNTTLQYLYSITDFLENDDNEIKSTAVTVAEGYKDAIGELKTKFSKCLGSGTNSNIFVTKNIEYTQTIKSADENSSTENNKDSSTENNKDSSTENNKDSSTETIEVQDNGYLKLDVSSLNTYLEEIETALGKMDSDSSALKNAIQSNNDIANEDLKLNENNNIPFTVNFIKSTDLSEMSCDKLYTNTDSDDYKECIKSMDKAKDDEGSNTPEPNLSFTLTLSDNLEDDGCDLKSGLCTQKLTTCLDFSDYFGSVYNFDSIIRIDDKKFTYDVTFASDAKNIITGFNIGGSRKIGGDLTTFTTSNKYNEGSDKENIINCSNNSSQDCYNKYKMTDVIVSDRIFPRLLDLNRKFLFPENSTTTNGEKTLSFKITSQDKKTNGENLAVFVGPADNLYDINKKGELCIVNGGQDCKKESDDNIFWLVGYESLLPVNNQLILKEKNPFKFNVNGQLVRTSNNDSIIKVNDIVNDNMISKNSKENGYNLAFFFKILDDDSSAENNSGFYTIKITELSDSAMDDIIQNWFERRQALSDSSINFKLEEPVSVVNLLFNSILGIMDGESYGVRNDERKCDKTLTKLKEDEEICFIHGYSKDDSLNGKSCGTDDIDGYNGSSEIAKEYCLQSCDQIGVNEVGVKCNIVYNNGGLLKLLYVNIIQNTLYQFIVKLALVLMLTLYGFGYFLGLSEFNQKEIMTRILRACFIYALISNTGWALYDKFVVSFFKQGIDSLLFLIASSFEVGENNYIEQAVLQNDYSVKLLLFSSTFTNIKMLFSEAVLYKILGLIFSGWLGILYAYLVLTGLITYIVGMFNAIALYLMAQMFMSVTLSIGPMIFLLMFFERTKGSFDNWLSILIGFALQEIFIIITVSFFNNLIGSIIKTVFAYPVCVLPILDINLLGVPLSILQFWKVPGTGFSGNILDLQNQAGPSFYSILLFYIVANLSNKFVTEMADLGNDIGDGIKATDIASGVTKAIGDVGNKMNGVIGGVASAPYTRASAGITNWSQKIGNEARQSMKNKFDALNEARISPIRSDLEKQLKAGTYNKDDNLAAAYKKAHEKGATLKDKMAYRKALNNAAKNERLEKLVKNENLDQTAREYFKKKGIDIDEKNKDGSDKYTENQKRMLKEYFLGEKGYVNKDSMGDKREVVGDLIQARRQVETVDNLGVFANLADVIGQTKKHGKVQMKKKAYDNYANAFAAFKDIDSTQKAEESVARPVSANLKAENLNANIPQSPGSSSGQTQNPNKPSEQQPQKPSENSGAIEQTVDRNIPQNTQASEGIARNPASEGE